MIYERHPDDGLKAMQLQLGCQSCFFGDPEAEPGFAMCTHSAPIWKTDKESGQMRCLTYRQRRKKNGQNS